MDYYLSQSYRVTKIRSAPSPTVPYNPARLTPLGQLQQKMLPSEVSTPLNDLQAGVPSELDRSLLLERLKPVGETDEARLEWLFLADWLRVEAATDNASRWLPVRFGETPRAEVKQPRQGGRPKVENDPAARQLYDDGERIRKDHPGITRAQVAARLTLSRSTYKRYVRTFKPRGA